MYIYLSPFSNSSFCSKDAETFTESNPSPLFFTNLCLRDGEVELFTGMTLMMIMMMIMMRVMMIMMMTMMLMMMIMMVMMMMVMMTMMRIMMMMIMIMMMMFTEDYNMEKGFIILSICPT
jgi:hypothetical protein